MDQEGAVQAGERPWLPSRIRAVDRNVIVIFSGQIAKESPANCSQHENADPCVVCAGRSHGAGRADSSDWLRNDSRGAHREVDGV
ncbi:MAG: hypothetical protein DWH81_04760 [Planctomycetota bacterium]|nr:MAG: hypothetical protein DWH81_04760 [Planctomycetota bacterium]